MREAERGGPGDGARSNDPRLAVGPGWAATALALALPWLIWRSMLGLELLGWDSFPLVAASRVEGLAGAAAELGEPLMDGRYPLGLYWRPLVHLSFALDHALWGLDARGYHATDLALLSINAALVATLARRWIGEGFAASAALVLAAHLVNVDVLWAPARRADALALAFTLAALVATSSFERRPVLRRSLVALACVAALMSKETGAAALAAVAAFRLVQAPPSRRIASTLREVGPAAAAFAAAFAARAWVLGGLGGASGSDLELSAAVPRTLAAYAPAALAPSAIRAFASRATTSAAAGAAALAVAFVLAWRTRAAPRAALSRGALLVVLAGWYVALAAVTALAGADRGWYELPFVAIHALFLVAALALLAESVPALRAAGAARVAALGALAASWPGAWTAVDARRFVPSELQRASDAQAELLRQVDEALAASTPASSVELGPLPLELRCAEPGLDGRARTVTALAPYSVDAYLELVAPELFAAGARAKVTRDGRLVVARP